MVSKILWVGIALAVVVLAITVFPVDLAVQAKSAIGETLESVKVSDGTPHETIAGPVGHETLPLGRMIISDNRPGIVSEREELIAEQYPQYVRVFEAIDRRVGPSRKVIFLDQPEGVGLFVRDQTGRKWFDRDKNVFPAATAPEEMIKFVSEYAG